MVEFAEILLEDNRTICLRMKGYSMYPSLREGDLGNVEKCSASDLRLGDIVVFKLLGQEVIGIANDYITKIEKKYITIRVVTETLAIEYSDVICWIEYKDAHYGHPGNGDYESA